MTRSDIMALVAGVEGWLSPRECETLFRLASRCVGRGVIVEIGSWKGRSTIVLASAARAACRSVVHAIDPHAGLAGHDATPTLGEFQRNLARAGLTDQVHPHVQTSAEAAREFAHPVELVFVDGAHDYASVLQDFALWFPKVVDGGVMAFHDTVGYAGPRRVVRDHLYRSPRFRRVRFADALTYAEKTHRATARERCANEVRWWMHQVYAGAFFVATRPRVKALLKRLRRRAPARTTAPRI